MKPHFSEITLQQTSDLLSILEDKQYSKPLNILNNSSIGQHVRHIIDFYLCILNENNGVISYDNRTRNEQIEINTKYCTQQIKTILKKIEKLDLNKEIEIHSCFTSNEKEDHTIFKSNINRELFYAFEHTIHHLALIKIGMLRSKRSGSDWRNRIRCPWRNVDSDR